MGREDERVNILFYDLRRRHAGLIRACMAFFCVFCALFVLFWVMRNLWDIIHDNLVLASKETGKEIYS